MFKKFEFIIALRYLRAKKKPKFLSVISGFSLFGVAIGVAALITVMSVMNGFRKEITEKIIGFNGEIAVTSYNNSLENSNETLSIIKSHPEVTFVYPVIEKEVLAVNKEKTSGAIIKALTKDDLMQKKIIIDRLVQGSITNFDIEDGVIVGYELAYRIGVFAGSTITLISPDGAMNSLIGMIPRMKTYKVLGLFDSGMYQFDSSNIIMPLRQAQTFFRMQNKISSIEAHIKDPLNSYKVLKEIDSTLKKQYSNQFKVTDWQTANQAFFKVLKVERVAMFFILTLIIIVAAFNIISSLVMLVKDKKSDIAILSTIGASKISIMRIFFLTGSMIGIMGTILGVIIGVSFSLNIDKIKNFLEKITATRIFDPVLYYLSNLPSDLQVNNILIVVCLSIGLSFIATLYPAYAAAKSNPLEALRYE
jgi:lipoprotein-releasing system permease protein